MRLSSLKDMTKTDLTNFIAPPHPKGISLPGHLVSLVPLDSAAHASQLFDAYCAEGGRENWTYLPYGPFDDQDSLAQWLHAAQDKDDPCFLTIIRNHDQRAVGIASYLRIKPQDGSIEVGHIHFSPLLQRTSHATEAMYLMMEWAFEAGYRRYEWKCNAKNKRSRKAAIRLGLSYEGVFRQATISKNQNRDTAWFAAIDSEWPALKDAFARYLHKDNYTQDHQPKTSLSRLTKPLLFKADDGAFSH